MSLSQIYFWIDAGMERSVGLASTLMRVVKMTPETVREDRRTGPDSTHTEASGIQDRWISRPRSLYSLARGVWEGFWLGLLDSTALHDLNEIVHSRSPEFWGDEYNLLGLLEWEKDALEGYFEGRTRILVGAAGAGREMLALEAKGYAVDGFECHPKLTELANSYLESAGYRGRVDLVPPDVCPPVDETYEGAIFGFAAYMYIQTRTLRVVFLRAMRETLQTRAPLLISFQARPSDEGRFGLCVYVGNFLRSLRRLPLLEVGDTLQPTFVHCFTEDEVRSEMSEAGFRMLEFRSDGHFGHAIGVVE